MKNEFERSSWARKLFGSFEDLFIDFISRLNDLYFQDAIAWQARSYWSLRRRQNIIPTSAKQARSKRDTFGSACPPSLRIRCMPGHCRNFYYSCLVPLCSVMLRLWDEPRASCGTQELQVFVCIVMSRERRKSHSWHAFSENPSSEYTSHRLQSTYRRGAKNIWE